MSFEAILLPMFVQVALTFVLLFWTIFLRLRAVRRGEVSPQQVALRQPNWPPHVQQVSNAFHNSVEMPTLFYVVVLLGLMSKTLDVTVYVLMWMFVLSRVVHAVIHVTSNDLRHRTPMFLIGAIALALIWILIAGRIIAFQSLS
ncbi:MAG TPA: MAPEG family protein [Methyloceanibacter sp.]|nr:MAPEG family protein [Methyloceanibacter sp.]